MFLFLRGGLGLVDAEVREGEVCMCMLTKRVPSSLGVALDPFFHSEEILSAVLQIIMYNLLVRVQVRRIRFLGWLWQRNRPRSRDKTGGEMVGACIRLGGGEVHVVAACGGVVCVEGVVGGHFTGIRIHASSSLTGFDVAPDHGSHVSTVVHETSIEVRGLVGVGADDVGETTREWILQEVEHGEELASSGNSGVVTEPTGNDSPVHDGLVGLVLEVAVPALDELREGRSGHVIQILLVRSPLDSSFDSIRCQRTSAVQLPLVEDLFLDLFIATGKIIKRLRLRLGAVQREVKVVVLEVLTNTGQVDDGSHAGLAKLLAVTNTRALQDKRRTERATADNDLSAGSERPRVVLRWRQWLRGYGADADGLGAFEDYLVDLGVDGEVEVLVVLTGAVDVCMSRVRATASVAVDPLQPVLGAMSGDKILKVIGDGDTLTFGRAQEVLHNGVCNPVC